MAIILVGSALRLYGLEEYPSGIHGDEAEFGLIAQTVLQGRGPNPFGTAFLGDPALFMYLEAAFLAIFGQTATAVRGLAAATGILTLPVYYIFMRRLIGRRPALLALAMLAGSALAVNFSRLALNVPQAVLLICLSLCCLWIGQQHRQGFYWLAAGVFGGLAVYFHFGARLLPVMMGMFVLYLMIANSHHWRSWARGALLSLLGGAMALAPMAVHLASRTEAFTEHMSGRLILNNWPRVSAVHGTENPLEVLFGQIRINALAFLMGVDGSSFYTFTGSPLLPAPVAWLAVLGLLLMLMRFRNPSHALLAIWFWSVVIVGGALTIDSPQAHRLIYALPPMLAGIALALEWIVLTGSRVLSPNLRPLLLSGTMLVPLVTGVVDNANYFGPAADAKPWEPTTAQARYVASLGPEYRVYVAGAPNIYFSHGVTRFLAPGVEGGELHNPAVSLPLAMPADKDLAFLVYPHFADYLSILQSLYPQAEMRTVLGRGDSVLFTAFLVARSEVARWQGLTARYGGLERGELDSAALGGGPAAYPADAVWTGGVYATVGGRYRFQVEGSASELLVDSVDLTAGGEIELSTGWHSLEVRGKLQSPDARGVLKWAPPGQTLAPVATSRLDARPVSGRLRGVMTAQGGEASERLDRTIGFRNVADLTKLRPPVSGIWEGSITIAEPGLHRFVLQSFGPAKVVIDGRTAVANGGDGNGLVKAEGALNLEKGRYSFNVAYEWKLGSGILEIFWTPPGGQSSIIPPEVFDSPQIRSRD